ncbi:DNA polymerase III subunit gamma and tau [Nocardioides seonyuensis]|uniref:DNA polymerase III subunit gamma/tau n=1 Tax=Nocardioides seonyuensis TaxID=2518371 RepID=A0A4P7IDE8_9ACTN|nr:DNA polymerase III subunit gamma and tau [Nocardioides seonyuensis]QBX55179.1 DNA polymerase III subunit gamma and tau [Nocardioides seonyuensis]
MESPLALYRRYRPETFQEVIGQDHVTEPLRAALAGNRVNHAYLFSGPRGCGKTTSARILARALNCVQAPVADPCGECDSCRDLARGGPGSIDVIEIDAASHGGVDDARDLREKAFFAPVRDRYKVYIIDEAHMVSTQGFNALLKLVEEPPPHLRFIFATTEPDKVLPTIRSRTHHYPFRLIPPKLLSDYLSTLCAEEGVSIEPAALPLVVRAGGGSARDTLSVLDQLLGGAGDAGVTHQLATDLLGFTPDSLLDEVVEAFAARDGAAVFGVVDKVVETGQDPRRFTEDLLRRLRDLVIVMAVPDAPATGLIDVAEDAGERLVAQSARFGAHELSRAADIVAAGLTEMRGATAPRLLLELVCAKVLLPGADHTSEGVMARLDRLERRMDVTGGPHSSASSTPPQAAPASRAPASAPEAPAPEGPAPEASRPSAAAPTPSPAADPGPPPPPPPPSSTQWSEPSEEPAPVTAEPSPEPSGAGVVASQPAGPQGGLSLVDVRRLWPDVLEALKTRRRLVWMVLSQNAHVVGVDTTTLTIGFNSEGPRESFLRGGGDEVLRQTAIDVIGMDWRIDSIVDPSHAGDAPTITKHSTAPAAAPAAPTGQPQDAPQPQAPADAAPAWASDETAAASTEGAGLAAAREALQQARANEPGEADAAPVRSADDDVDPDDLDAETAGLDSEALLSQTLGARLIEEIKHD